MPRNNVLGLRLKPLALSDATKTTPLPKRFLNSLKSKFLPPENSAASHKEHPNLKEGVDFEVVVDYGSWAEAMFCTSPSLRRELEKRANKKVIGQKIGYLRYRYEGVYEGRPIYLYSLYPFHYTILEFPNLKVLRGRGIASRLEKIANQYIIQGNRGVKLWTAPFTNNSDERIRQMEKRGIKLTGNDLRLTSPEQMKSLINKSTREWRRKNRPRNPEDRRTYAIKSGFPLRKPK